MDVVVACDDLNMSSKIQDQDPRPCLTNVSYTYLSHSGLFSESDELF